MFKSRPVHDLAGRDVQGPAESDTEADTNPVQEGARGRILLSIMESNWTISHAVVLLPKSYLEAKAMAIDAFHTQIDSKKIDVEDLVLRLGMKSSSGVVTWAPLRPKQWSDIVRDGDEIRVGGNDEEISGLYDPIPLVTFKKYPAGRSTTMILPKTIEDLRAAVRKEFGIGENAKFSLRRALGDDEEETAAILRSQWLTVILQLIKENPRWQGNIEVLARDPIAAGFLDDAANIPSRKWIRKSKHTRMVLRSRFAEVIVRGTLFAAGKEHRDKFVLGGKDVSWKKLEETARNVHDP